jgi:hypothetical protein
MPMTKKLILELEADESVWAQAEELAAQRRQPLEQWIVERVEQAAPADTQKRSDARRRALEFLDKGFPLGGVPLTREEVHRRRP